MNRVCLVGRLTAKPELRYTNSNLPFSRFSIAVNRTFSNSQGQREADFINIVVWRKQAENVCNFLDNRRYTFEVVADSVQFLESRAKTQNREQNTMSDNVSPYDYQNDNSFTNNISVENDPFADFGDNVTITDDFLD